MTGMCLFDRSLMEPSANRLLPFLFLDGRGMIEGSQASRFMCSCHCVRTVNFADHLSGVLATFWLLCSIIWKIYIALQDAYKSRLTFSGGKTDTMMVVLLRAIFNGPLETQLVTSVEQAIPVLTNWLNFNRIHGRAERTFPILNSPFKLRLCGKSKSLHVAVQYMLKHFTQHAPPRLWSSFTLPFLSLIRTNWSETWKHLAELYLLSVRMSVINWASWTSRLEFPSFSSLLIGLRSNCRFGANSTATVPPATSKSVSFKLSRCVSSPHSELNFGWCRWRNHRRHATIWSFPPRWNQFCEGLCRGCCWFCQAICDRQCWITMAPAGTSWGGASSFLHCNIVMHMSIHLSYFHISQRLQQAHTIAGHNSPAQSV